MKFAITHWYDFGPDARLVGSDLADVDAWDALRTASTGPFGLPESRSEWEASAEDPITKARAEAVDAELRRCKARAVASYAAGTAVLELLLIRMDPGRHIAITEFAPRTVERLERLFPEADICTHDLRCGPPLDGFDLHLFYRVDTELTDDAFRDVLRRFAHVPLLVVATELLTLRAVLREFRTRTRRRATRAGLVRSRSAFEAVLSDAHRIHRLRIHDLHGWLLEPR